MQAQSQSTLEAQGLQWAPFLRRVMFLEITEGTRPSHSFVFARRNTVLECVTHALSLSPHNAGRPSPASHRWEVRWSAVGRG